MGKGGSELVDEKGQREGTESTETLWQQARKERKIERGEEGGREEGREENETCWWGYVRCDALHDDQR